MKEDCWLNTQILNSGDKVLSTNAVKYNPHDSRIKLDEDLREKPSASR